MILYKNLGKTNEKIPAIGLGTYGIGGYMHSDYSKDKEAIELIRYAIEIGLNFIDTAEMYGSGHTEELIGEAIMGLREKVFIATKVSPSHFSYEEVIKACERSLKRLKTTYIDLYQLHWPNPSIPIKETMKAMEYLVDKGKIRYIGISNFSVEETKEAIEALSKYEIVSNQVEYSILERSIEKDLIPYCEREKISIIAYSPLARGAIFRGNAAEVLSRIAKKHNSTISQIALAWLIRNPIVVAIPKTSKKERAKEFLGAYEINLDEGDLRLINELSK
ncbi:MAG: aldo/keto reductase [Thermoproteota archaeon]|jgi:diketogulonate reductase-like aldo/keto reductase|nr:aldo/keto reductase [Thermoproteota archaeon]